jgi:hypothetical protein
LRISTFKKFVESISEEELRSELLKLYAQNSDVKRHYLMELGGENDRKKVYDKAKKDIAAKYSTRSFRRPKRPRISKVNAILKEINSISIFKDEMADLYLYNCQVALDFMEHYYFYSEPVVNNIFNSFKSACELIQSDMVEDSYSTRCENLVEKGFDVNEYLGQAMQTTYNEFF